MRGDVGLPAFVAKCYRTAPTVALANGRKYRLLPLTKGARWYTDGTTERRAKSTYAREAYAMSNALQG